MLYVECETEKILARTLQIPRKNFTHLGGKSRVLQRLGEMENSKGLVDEDPESAQPPLLDRYEETRADNRLGLKRLLYRKRRNELIVLCPRFEEWILDAARESNMNVGSFGLSDEPDRLREEAPYRHNNLKSLIEKLARTSNRMQELKRLLKRQN